MSRRNRPITGTDLFQRERCRRFVWLEFHGETTKKLPPDAATQSALLRGRAHEKAIVSKLTIVEPKYPERDFEAGARVTIELMQSKTPQIYQGVLKSADRVGLPDLLRFDAGSNSYIVGDVKASAEPKMEHAMQVAFYTELLNEIRQQTAPRAFIILADGNETAIPLVDVAPFYKEAMDDVRRMRAGECEPRPAHIHMCAGCAWRGVCLPEMTESRDLSLVFGMTPARRDAFESAGIRNITDLAAIEPAVAAERMELPRETLRRLKLQSAALLDGEPKNLGRFPMKAARIAIAAAIARDPRGTHFAEFLAWRTCKINERLEERWIHFEAAAPQDEERAFRSFLRALSEDRDAPIYHYGNAFADALASLDARFGKLNDPIGGVFDRLVDVQAAIRTALVLPVHHYDLASVARAFGVSLAEPDEFPGSEDVETLILTLRRRTAAEIKTIRHVRIAAQRICNGAPETRTNGAANGHSQNAPA
ncbi:MAG: TM0106 family RecB-like putative nuclease [Planctomycetes bacterium]|nr:TM0106 family RecB-like putative nuclease [Planctomycetota bacterium]